MIEIGISSHSSGDQVIYLLPIQPSVYTHSELTNYSINDGICVYYKDSHGPADSISKKDTIIIMGLSSTDPLYTVYIRYGDEYLIGDLEIQLN